MTSSAMAIRLGRTLGTSGKLPFNLATGRINLRYSTRATRRNQLPLRPIDRVAASPAVALSAR